ncbi:multiheme c-type cytochrome [Paraliomyxa miuraensis]|uniref:multiheme c-type cytochrome n=1 Tax=Paraliomyxa miuraensis TaxID=376150 RepID=UPI00225BEF62|nr:multiheme c-type cytochrome [Paraliomyxa miuraensis]MCX4239330.1 multiheme c-type cytochrome [Paraliomyxa miuraensis]
MSVPAEVTKGAHPARRCGECHAAIHQTWAASAHANADRSPIYRAMRRASGRDDCDRCHAPLRAWVPGDERLAAEGVTCDVCHTLRDVRPDRHDAALELDLTSAVRYGPRCDAEDHYFHRMGCSPLFSRSELCGGCHQRNAHTSEAVEFGHDGPAAVADVTCQSCHMPGVLGEVAVGWSAGTTVSDHGMYGPGDELRARAIELRLRVVPEDRRLRVELEVTNADAGHSLPSGLPGRRIVVRVAGIGADGAAIAGDEWIYAKILVDGSGVEVPFHVAQRVQSDTCLAPGEVRHERSWLPRDGVVEVRAEVLEHALSATIAKAVGVSMPEPVQLTSARAEVPPP